MGKMRTTLQTLRLKTQDVVCGCVIILCVSTAFNILSAHHGIFWSFGILLPVRLQPVCSQRTFKGETHLDSAVSLRLCSFYLRYFFLFICFIFRGIFLFSSCFCIFSGSHPSPDFSFIYPKPNSNSNPSFNNNVNPSPNPSLNPNTCLPVFHCVCVCLQDIWVVYNGMCLSSYLSVWLCVFLFGYLSVCPSICM